MKHVITSGYFNPIHPGHIEYLKLAKEQGDVLWVIVNNDKQAELKRGVKSFQDELYRMNIVESIKYCDYVILAIDKDGSVCETIKLIHFAIKNSLYSGVLEEIIFAKGGDRMANEIPERVLCEELGIKIVDNLGAKTHSSSEVIGIIK